MIPSVIARLARENLFDYLQTTYSLRDEALEMALFEFLQGDAGFFRGPYLDVKLPFRRAESVDDIPMEVRPDFLPYQHQLRAFERLYSRGGHQPQQTLVTTGTGSGKTECFLYPILDHCLRERAAGRQGIKAIILYPMNALASDQAKRLAQIIWDDERLKGTVSAGLYVGGEASHGVPDRNHLVDKREQLRQSPPDILLTNYKMLDYLLMRPEDRALWEANGPETLRYLVLDELHTYDGAQGSDVACLIRRLKARLEIGPGTLCCVGTSATIGEGGHESKRLLREFAGKVFEEDFLQSSIITEDRLSVEEDLGRVRELSGHPGADDLAAMDPSEYEKTEDWVQAQQVLWFGAGVAQDGALELGAKLKRNEFLHELLRALGDKAKDYAALRGDLGSRVAWFGELDATCQTVVLDSLVGLIAVARRESIAIGGGKGRIEPFLSVQVQLWLREVRHLLRAVDSEPSFRWRSDLGGRAAIEQEERWLPVIRCRDCGDAGWAAIQKDGTAYLEEDSDEITIGRAWMDRSPNARYVAFGHGAKKVDHLLGPEYLCPECLRLGDKNTCDCTGSQPRECLPVRVGRELTTGTVQLFKPVCMECGSDDGLMYLASRGSSLLSVSISHLYQTPYNRDKKLLAFTDSVQDASHRAGFFGSRTYRFNFRTMIQDLLAAEGGQVPLKNLGQRLLWHAIQKHGMEQAVPDLMPHDLRDHPEFQQFLEQGGKRMLPDLERWLGERLSLEATFEYGLSVRQGRSLQKVGCSTVELDADGLATAADELALLATEDGFLQSLLGGLTAGQAQYFLAGLISRTRHRGGVFHGWMEAYARSRGNSYLLSKRQNPCVSVFGPSSVYPRFLLAKKPQAGKRSACDAFGSESQNLTWYKDWAARTLGVVPDDPGIEQLYREAVRVLCRAELFQELPTETNGEDVWGVNPAALTLVAEVRELRCSECKDAHRVSPGEVEQWEGQPCTKYRCAGVWGPAEVMADTFYTRIYRSGRIARVFSEEHTGLLDRVPRERLEERFKAGSAPAAPNLLVCTPTLEMGIDIGNLSSVLLCSVPPTTSMYLQRVGRAGRKDGNAFCMTLAVSRPHDLYFHSEPSLMLEGAVDPPGCFLDAPEMLKRQLVAHAMDAWAYADKQATQLPRQVSSILTGTSAEEFPGRFLTYYEEHKISLCESFLTRFPEKDLGVDNREAVRQYGHSDNVKDDVWKAFDEVRKERQALSRDADKARERAKLVEAHPERFDNPDETKTELEESRRMLSRLNRALGKKYPLNLLTDAGVLPNYAFPEPGVILESVVSHESDGKRHYEAYEYMRPASVAIRELAPFNTFYAEGRRVQIDEVDLGSRTAPLVESWRLCAACNHTERVTAGGKGPEACPSCGDKTWADTGRVRQMLHFRRSRSLAAKLEVATADLGDDRQQSHYQTADLIDVRRENCNGARLIEEAPFGYELLSNLLLREVNFGPEKRSDFLVAGEAVNEDGFKVCTECGRVKNPGPKGEVRHAATCKGRQNQQTQVDSLYLYREIRSEAIRLLLPFAEVNQGSELASFKAALAFGLRQRYGGRADHLQIKTAREPLEGTGHRHFLVIFDSVPGGTGYLADLWRDDGILDLLTEALVGLRGCSCLEHGEDGCYRCLYAFQGQRELEQTSSRIAQDLLSGILDKRSEVEDVETLSKVTLDATVESELEARFVRALQGRVGKSDWRTVIKSGKKRWDLKVGAIQWELTAQVDLGYGAGVQKPSRPDFLLKALTIDADHKPIAVFCDGHAYHVCPQDKVSRLGDDVAKRRSILESGGYRVWSVTWQDVLDFEDGKRLVSGALLKHMVEIPLTKPDSPAGQIHERWGLQSRLGLAGLGSMELLWEWMGSPNEAAWRADLARTGVEWTVRKSTYAGDAALAYAGSLERSDTISALPAEIPLDPSLPLLARGGVQAHLGILAHMPLAAMQAGVVTQAQWTLRLEDSWDARKADDFLSAWCLFLQAWNLLQFVEGSVVTCTEDVIAMRELDGDYDLGAHSNVESKAAEPGGTATLEQGTQASGSSRWTDEGATWEEAELLESVFRVHGLAGIPGYELEGASGRCAAASLLGWEEARVALVDGKYPEDEQAFIAVGWAVLADGASAEDVNDLIEKQGTKIQESR